MKTIAATFAALIAASSLHAATVVTFDSAASTNHNFMSDYFEKGLQFDSSSGNGFVSVGSSTTLYTGSAALLNNAVNGVTTMTHVGGGLLTMQEITLSELFDTGGSSAITFTGLTESGSTVTQTFTLDGTFGNEVFTFSNSFTDLVSLSWTQVSPYHQFDDITLLVTAVPLPATAVLMLTGLGVFAGVRRKRKALA